MEIKLRDLYETPFYVLEKKSCFCVLDWGKKQICRLKGKGQANYMRAKFIAAGLNMLADSERY